ncbi:MAG TPA: PPC domain-containing DNA-binding protein [Caproiciproducens sp.]|nr:PPC domain-containing DNA-binding protein [Caproiciproducens sp.]
MNYKVFGSTIAVRIDRGEEILASVKEICKKENIKLASISAIGAVDHAAVGLYMVEEREYLPNTFDGEMEMTSLNGNVTTKDGEVHLHMHANFADGKGNAFGGHLNEAVISGTCEMFIEKIDGEITRRIDEVTGLNIFDI